MNSNDLFVIICLIVIGLEVLDEAFVNYPGARLHLLFAVELVSQDGIFNLDKNYI